MFVYDLNRNDLVDVKKEMATVVNVPQEKTAATINGGEHGGSSSSTLAGPGISSLSVIKTANGINLNGQLGSHLGIPKQLAQVFLLILLLDFSLKHFMVLFTLFSYLKILYTYKLS